MNVFSRSSSTRLETCHEDLKTLFREVLKTYDCAILCGYRGEKEQSEAFERGMSKVQFPNSKHNHLPAMAVDVMPYPYDWNDTKSFYHFIGYVRATANKLNIKIRSGGDWDGDFNLKNQNFFDLPHFELLEVTNADIK